MRAIIVHTPEATSVSYAEKTINSLRDHKGWEPELMLGVTPDTLNLWRDRFPFPLQRGSRLSLFKKNNPKAFPFKHSCAMNHYRFYQMVLEEGDSMAFIENDAVCLRDWDGEEFEGVLSLNAVSAEISMRSRHRKKGPPLLPGIHPWTDGFCKCHHHFQSGYHILGTASYAITVEGARKMASVVESLGWEQSDVQTNSNHVPINYVTPEYFSFHSPNLKASHGF
jgi:hypothetical protein